MRFLLYTSVLWAGMFAPFSLSATSIIPFVNLGDATNYSECVVLARALESVESSENGATFKDTRFESIETIKGTLIAGTTFTLRPYSHQNGDYRIDIVGDFKPETGKTYLLFLYKSGNFWRPIMLSYYVFEQLKEGDEEFLAPIGGRGIEVVSRPDGQLVEPLGVFQQGILLQQLHALAGSPQMIWDGSIGRSTLRSEDFKASDRAVPVGCDFTLGGNLSRWQNAAIPVFYDNTSNPVTWGTRFGNILAALNSNYTGIDPSNGGSRNYVPDCDGGSAIGGNFISFCDNNLNGEQSTLIMFDDPCNEIPDLSGCSGTLAFGGSYSSSDTHQFDGLTWDNALYGFVVVNNGAPACLSDIQFERMMTHELTHVYRMGHLDDGSYPNQNMNPNCCNAINTKDRECMNYAYPGPAPVELLSFEARLLGAQKVKLNWVTESEKDNAFFSIHRSANGIKYELIQEIASTGSSTGGSYEYVDVRPLTGLNYYLLSQTDFDGTAQQLGIKVISVGKNSNDLNISPNPVHDQVLDFSLELQHVFDGVLEIFDTDGRVLLTTDLALEKGVQRLSQPLGELPEGVYLLRLHDGQAQWAARFLKQ